MKFVSRDEWGARAAGGRTAITPRGVAIHWEGPHMGIPWSHELCAGKVKGIQNYHMDAKGWADIAYNALVCHHGYVFEGRGRNIRSAANGTNPSNSSYVAICYLGGTDDPFTDEAQNGINDAAEWLGGGDWTVHRDHFNTACPGDIISGWVRGGHPRVGGPAPQPGLRPLPSGNRQIKLVATHSSLLLEAAGPTPNPGSAVQTWSDQGGAGNQVWTEHYLGDGMMALRNAASGLMLDLSNNNHASGTRIVSYPWNDSPAQKWRFETIAPNQFRIRHVDSGKVLDISGGDVNNGAAAILWDQHEGLNQRFAGLFFGG